MNNAARAELLRKGARPAPAELTLGVLVKMTSDEVEVVRELVLREAARAKQQGRKDRWEFLGGVIDGFNRGLHPERYGSREVFEAVTDVPAVSSPYAVFRG